MSKLQKHNPTAGRCPVRHAIASICLCATLAACGGAETRGQPDDGEWQIVGFVAPGVAAMAPDAAIERLGETVVYSETEARFGDSRCEAPGYLQRELDSTAFFEEFGSFPGQVGLTEEPIRVTQVSCAGDAFGEGGVILWKRDNAIVVIAEGIFFELTR